MCHKIFKLSIFIVEYFKVSVCTLYFYGQILCSGEVSRREFLQIDGNENFNGKTFTNCLLSVS